MKKQTGIWIDSSKAIIVTLIDGAEHITEIESDIENAVHHDREGDQGTFMGTHHVGGERQFEERKKHQTDSFLKDVLTRIRDSDEIFVFGPAEIKNLLEQHMEQGDPGTKGKLKSVETADSMTLNQVVARVKEFYKP